MVVEKERGAGVARLICQLSRALKLRDCQVKYCLLQIKTFQFFARIGDREAPIDSFLSLITLLFPSFDFMFESLFICNAALQALPLQDTQFDLRHVQPTAVFGRVMNSNFSTSRLASAGSNAS